MCSPAKVLCYGLHIASTSRAAAIHAPQLCKLQVQISPQRPVAAPGGSLVEQVMYPSPLPLPEGLTDVDTHLLAHLLQQVGLSELLQRTLGDWMLSQDWQGACHAMCHTSTPHAKIYAAALALGSQSSGYIPGVCTSRCGSLDCCSLSMSHA